ncbi:anhydro-N-acetylmuramic acid kinase [Halpernia frigidisoli]|uniref:Anhydro-N-acetylmuramic acid kinase n=1 Tax=Halpernia frigidisoli TaxID=1125876 RepID=A0A1I3CRY7_9FLAO|nr:anhydro-N-acetylmuramic acid kinase [Halpernia frigidisoli]SFH77292.1 anhydro-N-acetylmuramic acid kinase [Halpernia frigidisoli]
MNTYFALGLMSGTSLDGLDICYAKFSLKDLIWNFEILEAQTIPYSSNWKEKLEEAINLSATDLLELNSEYGFYLGDQIAEFIVLKKIKEINLISSHGHTVHHQPEKKFTCQIGDGRAIKIKNNFPVVYDFRSQDVLLGGNGAPLVPIGDEILFSKYEACLNLGGFSNISFKEKGKRMAFDISPLNIVLNHFSEKLGKKFDDKGEIAKAGIVNQSILQHLNNLEFYKNTTPKSLGFEFVKNEIFPLLKNDSAENILATFSEHAADKIAEILNKFKINNVLLTGGGTYNDFLLEKIRSKTDCKIIIPENKIIDFKEALIFGFMGVLKLRGENNVLCSATGSLHDHSSGILI